MTDFTQRRTVMVDTQVRPSDVTKFPIIEAMLSVPRELFVPLAQREAAYMGENLPLAPGRVLLDARTLSKMLDTLTLERGELVLDVAPGTGYSSAVIARMVGTVVALEPDAALAAEAARALAEAEASGVVLETGPVREGAAAHAPYDAMILQCGVEILPAALEAQLREGGRVVALFMEGALGVVRLGVKHQGVLHWRDVFNASAPVGPDLARPREFAL